MRVVVTGASGRLGRTVATLLLAQQIEVIGLDVQAGTTSEVKWICGDLCNLGHVFGALAGAEAVIHLGAIASPLGRPPEVVYQNNIMAQFNVFEAAASLGIRRVVSASSISAYGFPFQHRWSEPLYFPLDEQHPLLPQDTYGLSKANGEEIAAAYVRRGAGTSVSMRISTIIDDSDIQTLLERVRLRPADSASVLWSYVHVSDVAHACWLALTRPLEGHQIFHITSNDTTSSLPTDELLKMCFPDVPCRAHGPEPRWSLIDGTHAASVLGYQPRYRWSDALNLPALTEK